MHAVQLQLLVSMSVWPVNKPPSLIGRKADRNTTSHCTVLISQVHILAMFSRQPVYSRFQLT